jgi:hypothetical protein
MKLVKYYIWSTALHGAGEKLQRSVEQIMWEMKYYRVKEKQISYKQQNVGRQTGLVTSCTRTAFKTCYWRKDKEKGISDRMERKMM